MWSLPSSNHIVCDEIRAFWHKNYILRVDKLHESGYNQVIDNSWQNGTVLQTAQCDCHVVHITVSENMPVPVQVWVLVVPRRTPPGHSQSRHLRWSSSGSHTSAWWLSSPSLQAWLVLHAPHDDTYSAHRFSYHKRKKQRQRTFLGLLNVNYPIVVQLAQIDDSLIKLECQIRLRSSYLISWVRHLKNMLSTHNTSGYTTISLKTNSEFNKSLCKQKCIGGYRVSTETRRHTVEAVWASEARH